MKTVALIFALVVLNASDSLGTTRKIPCSSALLNSSGANQRHLSGAQITELRAFLTTQGITAKYEGEANDALATLYEKRGYTPNRFLDELITKYPQIAHIAIPLRDEVKARGIKLLWKHAVGADSSVDNKEIRIAPCATTGLKQDGYALFLIALAHELAHRMSEALLIFQVGMSYEDFAQKNYATVAVDEVNAMLAGALVDAQLVQLGWIAPDMGGHNERIRNILHLDLDQTSKLLLIWHGIGESGYHKEHWPRVLRAHHSDLTVYVEWNRILVMVSETNLPVSEKFAKAKQVIQDSIYREDLLPVLHHSLHVEWPKEEQPRQDEFNLLWDPYYESLMTTP